MVLARLVGYSRFRLWYPVVCRSISSRLLRVLDRLYGRQTSSSHASADRLCASVPQMSLSF